MKKGQKGKADKDKYPDRLKTCERVFELMRDDGLSAREACILAGAMAWPTFIRWLDDTPHHQTSELRFQYARARELRADWHFERMLKVADEPLIGTTETVSTGGPNAGTQIKKADAVDRSKLMVDTRKWVLARMNSKKYGDKIEQTIEGGEKPLTVVTPGAGLDELDALALKYAPRTSDA